MFFKNKEKANEIIIQMVEEIFLDGLLEAQDDAEAEDVELFLPDCSTRAGRRGFALMRHCGVYILTKSHAI